MKGSRFGKHAVKEIVQRIRNPLNALQLHIDSLEDDITEANIENGLERLRRVRNTIAELDSLLCAVLRLTDLPKPQIAAISVNALVREVETFARPEASKKELTVRVDLQDNVPEIQADPTQIKQATLNVFLNAIENSPFKGCVTLATGVKNDHILIKVQDEGEGVPQEHRHRIFEPFFSTKNGGGGLGLPLALEIIRVHGGQISFTSGVGKGSTFIISLPFKADMG